MGDSHCSKIAVMQLFHELKTQFPTLPDHIISQCIAQNSCNRKKCEQFLRNTQELRPPLGKFPPVHDSVPRSIANAVKNEKSLYRPHRPVSLNIQQANILSEPLLSPVVTDLTPTSAPPLVTDISFFQQAQDNNGYKDNFVYTPVNNSHISKRISGVEARTKKGDEQEYSRSYTSVTFTLRPPSSEPQTPVEICSQGSSLTYSTSSRNSGGFQIHLQICIGPSNPTSVTAARIKHPMNLIRPNTLTPLIQNSFQKPPGLPTGLLNPSIKPAKTMSAPTTPSNPSKTVVVNSGSLPTTPTTFSETNSTFCSLIKNNLQISTRDDDKYFKNEELTNSQKQLIEKQLLRKIRLAEALQMEKEKLEVMKQEIKSLSTPELTDLTILDKKQRVRSQIYQLQLECDRLAKEIDRRSEQRVPLGETNQEFYRSIYTGQKIKRTPSRVPPIPSRPPVWQPEDVAGVSIASPSIADDEREERLGPPWICSMCTFANHPLISACEQCNMPRLYCTNKPGEMKDIRIRVTHRQNFPPRRTGHSWAV